MEREFNFDLERMEKAVSGGRITIPRGLAGAGQLKQFLRDNNVRLGYDDKPSDYNAAELLRGLIHG